MARTDEERAAHAEYMRGYYNDPEHPERREKKRAADRAYYQENEENLEKNRTRALAHYYKDPDDKKRKEARRRFDRKVQAMAILGGKCFRCGEGHPAIIDFHHREPELKKFRISDGIMSPKKHTWEEIREEIMKCDLLCQNCHGKEHSPWYMEYGWDENTPIPDNQLELSGYYR